MNSLKVGNKYPNHLRTTVQGLSVLGWVMTVIFNMNQLVEILISYF